jgi:hypothetical protein
MNIQTYLARLWAIFDKHLDLFDEVSSDFQAKTVKNWQKY